MCYIYHTFITDTLAGGVNIAGTCTFHVHLKYHENTFIVYTKDNHVFHSSRMKPTTLVSYRTSASNSIRAASHVHGAIYITFSKYRVNGVKGNLIRGAHAVTELVSCTKIFYSHNIINMLKYSVIPNSDGSYSPINNLWM